MHHPRFSHYLESFGCSNEQAEKCFLDHMATSLGRIERSCGGLIPFAYEKHFRQMINEVFFKKKKKEKKKIFLKIKGSKPRG